MIEYILIGIGIAVGIIIAIILFVIVMEIIERIQDYFYFKKLRKESEAKNDL